MENKMDSKDEADSKNSDTAFAKSLDPKTFNTNDPIAEFLRLQKGMIDSGISADEFAARYDRFCQENGYENDGSFTRANPRYDSSSTADYDANSADAKDINEKSTRHGNLSKIVLKFTTLR